MRSLHPVSALQQAGEDLGKAAASATANRAPDGYGWTGIHIIRAPDDVYEDLQLTALAGDLEQIFPRIRNFAATASAGFGAHDPLGVYDDDAWCFGLGNDCFIKLEPEGDFVRSIWYEARAGRERIAKLREAMEVIDRAAPSIVVDYWLDYAGAVSDAEFMRRYCDALAG
jgi:hypothetical protein